MNDPVIDRVVERYYTRSAVGIRKYGVTVDKNQLTKREWLSHLQEELMDSTIYIQKLIEVLDNEESY